MYGWDHPRNKQIQILRAHQGFSDYCVAGRGRLARANKAYDKRSTTCWSFDINMEKYDMDKVPVTWRIVAIMAIITNSELGLPLSFLGQM